MSRPHKPHSPNLAPRPLRELSIELTSKCNLTCEMCSVWKGRKDGVPGPRVRALITEARALGARVFTPSGAEVFMRKDTVSLLEHAAAEGFEEISVVNNGMLLEKHLPVLRTIPGLVLHVSIDGPRDVHDALRGPGSYDKALAGACAAVDAGIPVSLKGVLMAPTLDHASHLLDLCESHGFFRVSYQPFQPEIAGQDEDHSRWVFPEADRGAVAAKLAALLDAATRRGIDIFTRALFPHIDPYLFEGLRPIPEGGCALPAEFLLIDGRGEVFPCFFMRGQSMGNVNHGVRLRDIWLGPVQTKMRRLGLLGQCPGCLAGCSDVASFDTPASGRAYA